MALASSGRGGACLMRSLRGDEAGGGVLSQDFLRATKLEPPGSRSRPKATEATERGVACPGAVMLARNKPLNRRRAATP